MSIICTHEESSSLSARRDGELARFALEGDERAFEALVTRYNSQLFHFIYRLLGDYDRAWDVLQQVMIQLYKSLSTLRPEGTFKAWLFQVAYHRAIDDLRRKRMVYLSELDLAENESNVPSAFIVDGHVLPEGRAEYHELQSRLQQAIADLPERFRTIVRLHYTDQLTFREISAILHIPEATAKTYFQRAKPLLRQALQAKHAYELLPAGR